MAPRDGGYEASGEATLRELGIPLERLGPGQAAARFSGLSPQGLRFLLFEPEAGALRAREAVRRIAALLESRGVRFARGAATLGLARGGRLLDVRLGTERIAADSFVFACGPWLPRVFPELLGDLIRVRRAEELYFGVPPGDTRFDAGRLPTWIEIGAFYGVPALDGRGFKLGIDRPGPEIDPDADDRSPDPAALAEAREFLARRFPALARAPLLEARVCTYELTPDEHLLLDRHPQLANLWLLGGGSGHAFKLGPVLGEQVAALVAGERPESEERFRISPRAPRAWRQA
jgi:glycine/D-amino acid oxidase-like deaminating enzyme